MLKIRKETALDLSLSGSVGSFNVGAGRPSQHSLEVKYFLTHVGLHFSYGSNEKVLSHLAPVREIFDFEQLDFDEIMQRDIDDARVSGELVPYLLDAKSTDLIKLFPPIIVVVLPVTERENRPADLYPKVDYVPVPPSEEVEHERKFLRAGVVGQEVFQFEQPVVDGQTEPHDLVRFRLNTHKTRLVIVDGQHRAMALLALYRNLKDEWSDEKRAPFKEYYAEWTPAYIQQFNLSQINLPVMFCTFPGLCEGYSGDLNLKKAARAIFLTLNKTARKVSNSRNILLDDNDLIALFLRRTLSVVKAKDARSPRSLRIFHVELDQFEDRIKIKSPIAVTGVNHIYYLVEHLLLNKGDEDVNGAKPRSGKFYKRKDLSRVMERLDARERLGVAVADATTRDIFTAAVGEQLGHAFYDKYGSYVVRLFEGFDPYEIHNRSVLDLENRLEALEDRKLRPILFEGQGIGRVFEAHRENVAEKLKFGDFETDVPEIKSLLRRLDGTAERIRNVIEGFRTDRATSFLAKVSEKGRLRDDSKAYDPKIVRLLSEIYDNIFCTVAFQTAVICGFFGEIERSNREIRKRGKGEVDVAQSFEEYVSQLSIFFVPTSYAQFKKLVRLFVGEMDEVTFKVAPSKYTFRAVVYRGEMQPDQWPKYKYLLLELWNPSDPNLKSSVEAETTKCRKQVFKSLYDDYRAKYAIERMKPEDALEKDERRQIADEAFSAFREFLRIADVQAGDIPQKNEMLMPVEGAFEDADTLELEPDRWESLDAPEGPE
jgi:hypothetical protein